MTYFRYSMLISVENDQVLVLFGFMVLNATFNNITVIWWRSVLLVEETGVPRENHRPAASHWQIWSDNIVLLTLSGSRTHNISSDSKWTGTIYKFIIIFQHFSLKKIKWQRFFYMKILKKKHSQRKIAFPWVNFKFASGKKSPFANPRRNSESNRK